jgi:hypothetical protein
MEGVNAMRIPITPLAIDVFGKAALEPVRHRRIPGESRPDRRRETPPRPIQSLLVAVRLRAARA